jgi:hypothetical protein
MSSKKAASGGSNASESVSRLGGGLALKFNDPASFIKFIDNLANHVRMTYGDIASFVKAIIRFVSSRPKSLS